MDATLFARAVSEPDEAFPPEVAAQTFSDPAAGADERNASLLAVVRAYRRDRRHGGLLLELFGPAIAEHLLRFEPQPAVISDADLRSQMVVEVLHAAAYMPMPADAHDVELRILRRAGWMVHRWLAREARYQADIAPLPEPGDDDDDEVTEE